MVLLRVSDIVTSVGRSEGRTDELSAQLSNNDTTPLWLRLKLTSICPFMFSQLNLSCGLYTVVLFSLHPSFVAPDLSLHARR